jgi:hypothetical protein
MVGVQGEIELDGAAVEELGGGDMDEACGLHHAQEAIDEEEQDRDNEEEVVPDGVVEPEEREEEVEVVDGEEDVVEAAADEGE